MAYMNQERKAKIAARLKTVVPKGWKYSLAVDNHSTIVMTVKSAPVDIITEVNRVQAEAYAHLPYGSPKVKDHFSVNKYYIDKSFDVTLPVIAAILDALNLVGESGANHDKSDIQTDYFDVGWYVTLQFGKWNQPFVYDEQPKPLTQILAGIEAKQKLAQAQQQAEDDFVKENLLNLSKTVTAQATFLSPSYVAAVDKAVDKVVDALQDKGVSVLTDEQWATMAAEIQASDPSFEPKLVPKMSLKQALEAYTGSAVPTKLNFGQAPSDTGTLSSGKLPNFQTLPKDAKIQFLEPKPTTYYFDVGTPPTPIEPEPKPLADIVAAKPNLYLVKPKEGQ